MEEVKITARWANRVLRPLASIYRRIEKHQARLASVATDANAREAAEGKGSSSLAAQVPTQGAEKYLGLDTEPEGSDPAWIPGTTLERRRARHKYTSRLESNGERRRSRFAIHSPESPRILPGAIEVATPLITGRRGEVPSSAQSHRSTGRTNDYIHPPPQPVFHSRRPGQKSHWQELLEQAGDPDLAHLARNLDRVFLNFLFSTKKKKHNRNFVKHDSNRGARSLMSMVARSLPDFFAMEQEAQDQSDEDGNEDICDVYFTELESFYAPHGTGWEPLREAVRAQGIHLVAHMIKNNWITDPMACVLVERSRAILPEESDLLLSVLLDTRESYPYPQTLRSVGYPDPEASRDPIRLLRKYAHYRSASRSYIFDELAKLLFRGVMPPEWMGSKLWTGWMTRATKSFSRDDVNCPAASRLIEAVILSACGIRCAGNATSQKSKRKAACPRATRAKSTVGLEDAPPTKPCPIQIEDALSNHIISLMAVLCAVHISRSRAADDTESTNGTKASHIISYLQFALQRYVDSRPLTWQNDVTPHELLRRGCILLSTSIVQCNDTLLFNDQQSTIASTVNIEQCAEAIVSRADMIRELALFLRQALRYLRPNTTSEPQRTDAEVRHIVSRLACISGTPGMSNFLGYVAADAAMAFAEATGDPDDHVWAVEVQEAATIGINQEEKGREILELTNSSRRNGYFRWEESIGEWVAPTPVTKRKLHIVPRVERTIPMLSDSVACIPCPSDYDSPGADRFQLSDSGEDSSPVSVARTPCPSDCDSPESDRFQLSDSSADASPLSVSTKRICEDNNTSQALPNKRQRPIPMVVIDNGQASRKETKTISTTCNPTRTSTIRVEILRERTPNVTKLTAPAPREASKLGIVNGQNTSSQDPVQSHPERVETQIHRNIKDRRSSRPSVPVIPKTVRRRSSRQMVVPCSPDSNSDDELSFL